jgi:hypothetical protein
MLVDMYNNNITTYNLIWIILSFCIAMRNSIDTSTVTAKAKQYQECNTLVTRIEVRIMRLKREKGERITGALQATQDPNVPNSLYWYYT